MALKLNLGAGHLWQRPGWEVVDHQLKKPSCAWSIPLPNGSCSVVFTCHMIEHVPHYKIETVLSEINRVLEVGGLVRILTPDLRKLAEAYVNRDAKYFKRAIEEDDSIRTDLGFGGSFVNFIVSPGADTILCDNRLAEMIGGYAHLYCYDFEMLEILLRKHGFADIIRSDYCSSSLPELREPRVECAGVVTGFDRDPVTSLIVEATKHRDIDYANYIDGNKAGAGNFNYYGFHITRRPANRLKWAAFGPISRVVELLVGPVRKGAH